MNVEIRVEAAVANTSMTMVVAVAMVRALAGVRSLVSQTASSLVLTFLRQGRSSLSAIPANINFTLIGGEAA